MDKINQINVEPLKLLRPIISGLIMNAYYSLLNLKQSSGVQINDEERKQTILEVFDKLGAIDRAVEEILGLKPSSSPATP